MARKPAGIITEGGSFVDADVLGQYTTKAKNGRASKQADPKDDFQAHYGNEGLVPPIYNPKKLARVMEQNTYHNRCVKVVARDTAGLGWYLEPVEGKRGRVADRKRLEGFFGEMSDPVSSLFNKQGIDYGAVGWGALEMAREGDRPDGDPVALYHIPAHTLRVHESGDKYRQLRGRTKRWFKDVDSDVEIDVSTGEQLGVSTSGSSGGAGRANEAIFLKNYTPRSDFYGLPDFLTALPAIHGEAGREKYNLSFFANYGVPAYAVFITGDYDEGKERDADGDGSFTTELQDSIEQKFREFQKKPYSNMVIMIPSVKGAKGEAAGEIKVEFQALQPDIEDASFRLFRMDNRDEILHAHGVPPYRVGVNAEGSLGGNTAAESTEIYKQSVVRPRQEAIETVVTRYVIQAGFGIEGWAFRLAEMDTRDRDSDSKRASLLVKAGLITPNEGRALLDYEDAPDAEMDEFYVNGKPLLPADEGDPEGEGVEDRVEKALYALEAHESASA